jgi:hypothetical protein
LRLAGFSYSIVFYRKLKLNNIGFSVAPSIGPSDPSPSALFARRLMHFCSDEVASLSAPHTSSPKFAFTDPPPPQVPFFPGPGFTSWREPWLVQQDLSSVIEEDDPDAFDLEELEESLDVLLILERAYARTLQAHVTPVSAPSRPASPTIFRTPSEKPPATVPLMTGSSTALLAVLDSAGAGPRPHPAPEVSPAAPGCDAVLRIAHLGDCMGMLVRGDEIVWRSAEMWWRVCLLVSFLSLRIVVPDRLRFL